MRPDDVAFLTGLVAEKSGLALSADKVALMESRLMPVARRRGLKGPRELVAAIRGRPSDALIRDVTEAMTVDDTAFFRDTAPFALFRDVVLPQLLERRAATRAFRIWCAAAATGQEPYSLAMILKEAADSLTGWRHEIVATDVSAGMLAKARAGVYSQFEVQRGLPVQMLMTYFTKRDALWEIDPALRAMVRFREFDLRHGLRPLGRFDVVFCRNVLIYFDDETKGRVLNEIRSLMPDDGVLFLGQSETVHGISDGFTPLPDQRGVFRPADGPAPGSPASS